MLEIQDVAAESIAQELGLRSGDKLVAINGHPVRDLVDYRVLEGGEELVLEIRRLDDEHWEFEIEKDAGEPLGLVLPHPQPMHCGNNCIFCFVHQLPRNLRPTLYVKDEDYRFSYLYGAYVTLSNIGDGEVERILDQHLSPLYVSVHATREDVRSRLLGRVARPLIPLLQRLVAGGIHLHTQVVVCPGFNDGEVLRQTYADLLELETGIRSLALVPVGLTGYRDKLPRLRTVSAAEAAALVDWVHARQTECLQRLGRRFVFAADEMYLKAGLEIPPLEAYEDLPQLENGVGLIALFRHQEQAALRQSRAVRLPKMALVTGVDAAGEVKRFIAELTRNTGCQIEVYTVNADFFGGEVTVTGLLAGRDLLRQLAGKELGEILLLPDVLLREGDDVLLDDMNLADLATALEVRVETFPADPLGLWDLLDTLDLEMNHQFDEFA